MLSYDIRPQKIFPKEINAKEVKDYFFIRETEENLYELEADDFIRKIIPSNTSSTDIFEFSIFLYGYYNEEHLGIRNQTQCFPLYLQANILYERQIYFKDEYFMLSFYHFPTSDNYWHFQLYTLDNNNIKIPRNTKKTHDKNLAKFIAREYIKKAVCSKTDVMPFHRSDFEKYYAS